MAKSSLRSLDARDPHPCSRRRASVMTSSSLNTPALLIRQCSLHRAARRAGTLCARLHTDEQRHDRTALMQASQGDLPCGRGKPHAYRQGCLPPATTLTCRRSGAAGRVAGAPQRPASGPGRPCRSSSHTPPGFRCGCAAHAACAAPYCAPALQHEGRAPGRLPHPSWRTANNRSCTISLIYR